MTEESFGRQPKPVTVIIEGSRIDREYWKQRFIKAATFKGDEIQSVGAGPEYTSIFKIYPRAVND